MVLFVGSVGSFDLDLGRWWLAIWGGDLRLLKPTNCIVKQVKHHPLRGIKIYGTWKMECPTNKIHWKDQRWRIFFIDFSYHWGAVGWWSTWVRIFWCPMDGKRLSDCFFFEFYFLRIVFALPCLNQKAPLLFWKWWKWGIGDGAEIRVDDTADIPCKA